MAESPKRRVGAYAKLLANYASDDAIMAAGEAAELLFVRGLAFCATSDSDGYITDAQVSRYVGAGMRDAKKRAERLADVGVWERAHGGYIVRSWLKLHESAEDKGRKLKADRDRKRKAKESETSSERNPDGIQTEEVADSLSMTRQDTTEQDSDTTEQGESQERGQRPVTLRPVTETEPPPTNPADARCTGHRGVADPGPCNGCRIARERAERHLAHALEADAREAEALARACTRCDGTWEVDDNRNPTRHRCDHRRRTA